MANAIKPLFASPVALTLSFAPGAVGMASSTTGVGRQSTMVDNSTNRYKRIQLSLKVTMGTTPTVNRNVYVHLIRDNRDATAIRDDNAGTTDAAFTIINAPLLMALTNTSTSTGTILRGNCVFEDPGPGWGIGIYHDCVAALDATESNHVLSFVGISDEIQ